MTQFRSRPEEPKPEPKAEAKKPEPKKEESGSIGKVEGVKSERRNRVTVLRDLVEELEANPASQDQRDAFRELSRRLTRALAN